MPEPVEHGGHMHRSGPPMQPSDDRWGQRSPPAAANREAGPNHPIEKGADTGPARSRVHITKLVLGRKG